MNLREVKKLAHQATAEPVYGECVRCHADMMIEDGLDPTPLCHPCAQFTSRELGYAMKRLLAEYQRIPVETRRRVAACAANCRKRAKHR